MYIVLQGARGYSASKAASDSAPSSDAAVTSCCGFASRRAVERVIPFNETERNYDRRDDLLHMRTSERCLISLTIFSFVSLASLGPRIAIGTPDH